MLSNMSGHDCTIIEAQVFDADRMAVYRAIAEHQTVFHIQDSENGSRWVLGPVQILGAVFGLYDEEYGWPYPVSADAPLGELRPAYRRHPVIDLGNQQQAIVISIDEWSDLRSHD